MEKTLKREKSPILTKSYSLFSSSLGTEIRTENFLIPNICFLSLEREKFLTGENSWNFKVSCKRNVNHLKSQQLWSLADRSGPICIP